jgi:hypothetical protein
MLGKLALAYIIFNTLFVILAFTFFAIVKFFVTRKNNKWHHSYKGIFIVNPFTLLVYDWEKGETVLFHFFIWFLMMFILLLLPYAIPFIYVVLAWKNLDAIKRLKEFPEECDFKKCDNIACQNSGCQKVKVLRQASILGVFTIKLKYRKKWE